MRAEMAAEDILCLLLARGTLPPELRKQASDLLANPLRWDRLLDRAKEHQVFPLVYRNLRDLGFSGVPEPIRVRPSTTTWASRTAPQGRQVSARRGETGDRMAGVLGRIKAGRTCARQRRR